MTEQIELINNFMRLCKIPSYGEMSRVLGISKSRAHRIHNGSELYFKEYLKIKKLMPTQLKQRDQRKSDYLDSLEGERLCKVC